MDKIKIFHAFNGFLYAPLFLAHELGLFPRNTELEYTQTDKDAIDRLCGSKHDGVTGFAICDPFSIDLDEVMEHDDDELSVVASLIDVVPMWVFNPNPHLRPVKSEDDLQQYNSQITKLVCYQRGTTGHLIAERVRTTMGLAGLPLDEVEFGREFDTPPTAGTCIITADVLRLVHAGLNSNNIIYNYATRSPKALSPFLFTGILTLQNTVDHNLWPIIAVLGAIRETLDRLNERIVEPQYITALVDIYSRPLFGNVFESLSIVSPDAKARLVRESLTYLFQIERIYELNLQPKEKDVWSLAWSNARAEWIRQHQRAYPQAQEKYDRIPSLLVRPTWRSDLRAFYEDNVAASALLPTGQMQALISSQTKHKFLSTTEEWFSLTAQWSVVGASALLLTVVYCTFWADFPGTKKHVPGLAASLVGLLYCFQIIFFMQLLSDLRTLKDCKQNFVIWAGVFIAYVATVLSIALIT